MLRSFYSCVICRLCDSNWRLLVHQLSFSSPAPHSPLERPAGCSQPCN